MKKIIKFILYIFVTIVCIFSISLLANTITSNSDVSFAN